MSLKVLTYLVSPYTYSQYRLFYSRPYDSSILAPRITKSKKKITKRKSTYLLDKFFKRKPLRVRIQLSILAENGWG